MPRPPSLPIVFIVLLFSLSSRSLLFSRQDPYKLCASQMALYDPVTMSNECYQSPDHVIMSFPEMHHCTFYPKRKKPFHRFQTLPSMSFVLVFLSGRFHYSMSPDSFRASSYHQQFVYSFINSKERKNNPNSRSRPQAQLLTFLQPASTLRWKAFIIEFSIRKMMASPISDALVMRRGNME